MESTASIPSSSVADETAMSAAQLTHLVQSQAETIAALKRQLEWFRRQMYASDLRCSRRLKRYK